MLTLFVVAALSLTEVRPIRSFTAPTQLESPQIGYARDAQFEYLATPGGLYRSTRLADPNRELEPFAFANAIVHNVYVDSGALYVLKGGPFGSSTLAPSNVFFRSTDGGQSFAPLDAKLQECHGSTCEYLVSTRAAFRDGRIFLNAGGNVVVSGDDGGSWQVLYGLTIDGKPAAQLCPVKFAVLGEQMVLGGECPLDWGWLATGTLRPDRLGWVVEPRHHELELENRNVQFIHDLGDGVVLASIEGALLRSEDGGASFRFVFHYDISSHDAYPYIWEIAVSTKHPGLIAAGGFDKKENKPYLAMSNDGGKTWKNVSSLLPATVVEGGSTAMLAEDADGRLLAIIRDGDTFTLTELIVRESRPRRRPF